VTRKCSPLLVALFTGRDSRSINFARRQKRVAFSLRKHAGSGSWSGRLPTASDDELVRQAKAFADDISDLMNGTLTDGVRWSAVLDTHGGLCWLGVGVTKNNLSGRAVALRPFRGGKWIHLLFRQVLSLDPEGEYLTTSQSDCSVYADAELRKLLFHYDYAREPANQYPAAHVQVDGVSTNLQSVSGVSGLDKMLKDFHFPVGGRRFRPSLEDVVEFLIVEELVRCKSDWAENVARHRTEWEQRQLWRPFVAIRRRRGERLRV
jgi:hypothetical protein